MKLLTMVLATALAASSPALAQNYPSGQVTLIVPFAAGGGTDIIGRRLAEALQERWGQTVIVENHPGAGTMVGAARVAQAAPDGHTLFLTTPGFVTAPAIHDDLPFDPLEDVAPVSMIGFTSYLVAAGVGVEAETLEDFIEEARGRDIFMATAGLGSLTHFAGELLSLQAGFPVTAVHYGGGGPAMTDLMGGHADIYVGTMPTVIANVLSGQIKGLAILGAQRSTALPDVPTTAEAGIEDLDVTAWYALFSTGSTPEDVLTKIHEDVNEIIATEAFVAVLAQQDIALDVQSREDFAAMVAAELDLWRTMARQLGITGD